MAQAAADSRTAEAIELELQGIREDVLELALWVSLGAAWFWFLYSVGVYLPLGINGLAALLFSCLFHHVRRMRQKHYVRACWLLMVGMSLYLAMILAMLPSISLFNGGVVIVILASAFLDNRAAFLAMLLVWLTGFLGLSLGMGTLARPWAHSASLMLYVLVWGATWLGSRPVNTSLVYATSGWGRAHQAIQELQERRGQLYRAVHALEEATFRMERMNNELLVAQREAETARAIKGRFVAMVSHELRAPLNLILGFSQMMVLSPESYGAALPRPYRADVDAIYRNSQHLLALIDDILDLSRIEIQRLPLVKDRVDWRKDVVEKLIETVQPLAQRKGLYLRADLEPDLPWILADPVRLRQVLMNLLNNAIRLTEHGGITITTVRQEDDLLVSVRDSGPGIPPEDIPCLFQEFSQVHMAGNGEKGTGLGLSICKHLINSHGGTIWVESEVGKGTVFHFTLPLPGASGESSDTFRTGAPIPLPARNNCLLVHGDPQVARLLARQLSGYHLVGLPDSSEILSWTESLHPRAIITAPQWAEDIRAQLAKTPYDVPIVVSGLPSVSDQSKLAGATGYVVKPVSPDVLSALMKQVAKDGDQEVTVLLVDDDADAVRLLERMLLALPRPYRIRKAYEGAQALEILNAEIPDIMFMDLFMPNMDGWELLARLRADPRTRGVPAVIISAHDWTEENAVVSTPLTVTCRQPISLARAARCLGALLEALPADFLAGSGVSR